MTNKEARDDAWNDEREALVKAFADAIFHAGLRSPDSTMAVIALKEVLAARKHPEPEITDEMVTDAYRGYRTAQRGSSLQEGEFEATFSRVEFAWMRSALEAALRVPVGERGSGDDRA